MIFHFRPPQTDELSLHVPRNFPGLDIDLRLLYVLQHVKSFQPFSKVICQFSETTRHFLNTRAPVLILI